MLDSLRCSNIFLVMVPSVVVMLYLDCFVAFMDTGEMVR